MFSVVAVFLGVFLLYANVSMLLQLRSQLVFVQGKVLDAEIDGDHPGLFRIRLSGYAHELTYSDAFPHSEAVRSALNPGVEVFLLLSGDDDPIVWQIETLEQRLVSRREVREHIQGNVLVSGFLGVICTLMGLAAMSRGLKKPAAASRQ